MAAIRSTPPSPVFVDLPALLSATSDQSLLADPALSALMVEYSCWELHLADWYARQRPRRHREFNGWIVEGRALFDRLDELKKVAHKCLRSSAGVHERPSSSV
jgi:hypothetical protein